MSVIQSEMPMSTKLSDFVHIGKNVEVGEDSRICSFTNLYGCKIGERCMIGTFVEIQEDVVIGDDTRIQSHSFICSGTTIGNNCFVAHSVVFINDTFCDGKVHFDKKDWKKTVVGNNVKIGSNATIMPVKIGDNAIIGCGSVVLYDVLPNTTVVGNPAKILNK